MAKAQDSTTAPAKGISLDQRRSGQQARPELVERGGEAEVRTDHGLFRMVAYRDQQGIEHMAIVKGDVSGDEVLCRVHSECLTGEVFGSRRCECGPQLERALQRIEEAGRGVVVYLRGHEGRGIGLRSKLRAYAMQDQGADTLEANQLLGFKGDLRSYDVAAQILGDLGVRSVVLMTNNPSKVEGLESCGANVARRVEHHVGVHDDNRFYIETKVARMGHLIELDEAREAAAD